MKILLVGNPNVGKSAIFSRLTGTYIVTSNYPGSTVEYTKGYLNLGREQAEVIDAPGTYTLDATNKAEEVAVELLKDSDVVINVVDATNLERNLNLTVQLLEKQVPMVMALNMWDETRHKGIKIDIKALESELGVPVVYTCGLTGEGIKELVERLPKARPVKNHSLSDIKKWERIGRIIENVQELTHHHHTLLQWLEELSIRPVTGIPISLLVIYCAFWVIRFVGEGLMGHIFEPFFENVWLPLLMKLSPMLGEGSVPHRVIIGNLIDGTVDFSMSFGLLSTGLFMPIAMVLPYIFSFYLKSIYDENDRKCQ